MPDNPPKTGAKHRRRAVLSFAGSPRAQEAIRKRLAVGLRRLKRTCELRVRQAERLLEEIACDVTILATKRKALSAILNLDVYSVQTDALQLGYLASDVAQLFGINREDLDALGQETARLLLLNVLGAKTAFEQTQNPPASARIAESVADTVLEEAERIVSEAGDMHIDWSHEPQNDQERKIRLAVIQCIESEKAIRGAIAVLFALEALTDSDTIASDLYRAIERWEQRAAENAAQRRGRENQRLLRIARHKVRRLNDGDSNDA